MTSNARSLARAIRSSPVLLAIIETPDDTNVFSEALSTATGGKVASVADKIDSAGELNILMSDSTFVESLTVGQLSYTEADDTLYFWNGTEWKQVIFSNNLNTALNSLISSAPEHLDTLSELAASLNNDSNFASTITNILSGKVDASSLSAVATSGSYNDLTNKPSVPSLSGYATETYVQNYVLNNSSPPTTTVTTVSSPNVSLDLNNTYFKLDMTADTTISTTNHPPAGEVYEGRIQVTGNEDINAFNLFSNPNNAISGWRTSVTYSGATDFGPASNVYSFGCVSWDGVYMVLGAYTNTAVYKIQVIQMSTPFDPSTGTKVRSETNVHSALGSSLNIRGGAKFLSDNVTVHIGGVNKYYNVTNGAISNASGTVPIQQSWSRGTWSNNGTLYYVAQKTQNQSPKVWKYTNNGTPYSFSSLSLTQTKTITPSWGYNLTGTGSNANPSTSTNDQYMSVLVSDDGTKVALLGMIEGNNYNIYPMRYTMSDPHNLNTLVADTSLTYNIPLGNPGVHSQWLDGGRYLYTGGTTIIKNLATPAVNNTITWPNNFNWLTEGDEVSPNENQVKIYDFITIDGGVSFNASVKK